MRISEKIDQIIHPIMKRMVLKKYQKKVDERLCSRVGLNRPCSKEVTEKHLALYRKLGLPCNDKWLRLYSNLSGIEDYTYLPEDLYFSCIERVLNDCNRAGGEAEDKNQLAIFIDKQLVPKVYLRFVRGLFMDEDYNVLSYDIVETILHTNNGALIGKAAVESSGGHGVHCFIFNEGQYKDKDITLTREWIEENQISFLLQERVEQCDFSAQFNFHSANTCRIITLRCPWNGQVVVTKAAMRIGATECILDNLSSGGMAVALGPNGELSSKAIIWKGMTEMDKHPESGISFAGKKHPYYNKMCDTVIKEAKKIPNFNILSWDVLADKNGNIKILEVNLVSQGTDILQFDFGSFFGKYTEPLIDWVASHKKYDTYRHFRTWLY